MDVTNLLYTPSSFSFLRAILEWLYKKIKNGLEILLESGDRAEKDFEGSSEVPIGVLQQCLRVSFGGAKKNEKDLIVSRFDRR
ncbi:hypothetical protein Tco_1295593 [Tanacetum coccineum]